MQIYIRFNYNDCLYSTQLMSYKKKLYLFIVSDIKENIQNVRTCRDLENDYSFYSITETQKFI